MSISMFVACNDNTTNTNTPTTPPDTTQEEQTGDLSDILGGTNVVPEGDRMQIPPTSGTYSSNALISLGTYSTYTFVGNEYEFKYYKFGALQPDKCHSGTFALANEKLVKELLVLKGQLEGRAVGPVVPREDQQSVKVKVRKVERHAGKTSKVVVKSIGNQSSKTH